MTEENRRKLWKLIVEAGDYLQGKLPDHPNQPKGRNPYAHVAICVKSKFEKPPLPPAPPSNAAWPNWS